MGAYAFDPLVQDLTQNPLSAKVYSTDVTADSDGFYYKSGQFVEISGDEQVKLATNAGKAMGILRGSRNTQNAPEGISKDNLRIDVTPIGYRFLMRMTAEGALTAGTKVCQGTTSKQAVKAMSGLSATLVEGGTTDNNAVTLTGGILTETEIGIVWKGAADGAEVLVLIR